MSLPTRPTRGPDARLTLKTAVKRVRDWPPLNIAATSVLRTTVRCAGWGPGPLVRYLPRVGAVDAPLPTGGVMRLWSKGDDDVASAVFWRGWAGHEPETTPHFFELARTARVTIDVGAHVGYFSVLAALGNPAGRVLAFEPLPPVLDRLKRNVSLNGLTNVSCHQLALGRQAGRADFFHVPHAIPSSSSLSRSFMESIVAEKHLVTSEVEVATLDDFLDGQGVTGVDLVKIDTEQTEDDVIGGMVRTMARDRPAIVCEILPAGPARAIEEMLTPLDYRYFLLTAAGPERRADLTPHGIWRNFLLRPAEHC